MLCYLRALLFKNSWYHYVILQRWGLLFDNVSDERIKVGNMKPEQWAFIVPSR